MGYFVLTLSTKMREMINSAVCAGMGEPTPAALLLPLESNTEEGVVPMPLSPLKILVVIVQVNQPPF